jgi:hypothetical protein
MKLFTAERTDVTEKSFRSIRNLLLTQGFGKTLEYYCTFSVFSIA